MSKKKIIFLGIGTLLVVLFLSVIAFYFTGLGSTGKEEVGIEFVVKPGRGTSGIIEDLKDQKLIRSEWAAKIYLTFHGDLSLKAGTYVLSHTMDAKEIFQRMHEGKILNETVKVTFVEGKRLLSYVDKMVDTFGFAKDEVLAKLKNETYLKSLIADYWFLTDEILDDEILYPLEGYLFPDTYEFKSNVTIEDVIKKLLDTMGLRLAPFKEDILASNYSVHEYLAIAAIIELEAVKSDDRLDVGQVIYNRLAAKMSLGMDVTTYYAVQKDMKDVLTITDLRTKSAYNTRDDANMAGKLPIGPICSPSLTSIKAALEPSKGGYYYFYANVRTGDVHFAKTYEEFQKIINEVG